MRMKVVVTGGTGFLGRHVVWRLAAEGVNVVFTGRNPQAAQQVWDGAAANVSWVPLEHGTPTAADTLAEIACGADAVVHCAALSSPWGRRRDFERANLDSTAEVLVACQQQRVRRLVHVSTPSLYFGFADRRDLREDAPLPTPANHYVRTKRAAEELIRGNPPPEVVVLRPRALFGPWDQTLVPRLLRVMKSGPVPLMRGGQALADLTYIDNAVQAVWLALTQPLERPFSVYNVTNGEPRPLEELLALMAREFRIPLRTRAVSWPLVSLGARAVEAVYTVAGGGREPPITRYSAGVLAFDQTLDIEALRTELGYRPTVGLEEGIRRHARWWREQRR
ncbi:NAD-dependent epimerase/dehydratase family protein [Hydrogenophaga sp.]|uniref:NAD-dependent epimerase/dehydratase family protein n=1 Tax=Hydrogenophaga sp. TaxID=1904254 RepID=UPI0035B31C66